MSIRPLFLIVELMASSAEERSEYSVNDVTEFDFNNYVSILNAAISSFDLEIRSTLHQQSRKRIFALVNSTSDPLTQLATVHTADEISYVKRLLDAMFETYNTRRHEIMAVTSMQAAGLAKNSSGNRRATQNGNAEETQGSAGKGLTLVEAERVLKSLVDEGWFEKSRKGFYSLSPRAIMELRGWLMETYNEDDGEEDERVYRIKSCHGCKEIITTVCPSLTQTIWVLMVGRCRVNAVMTGTASVVYMTSAHSVSSPCKKPKCAQSARKHGRGKIWWEKELRLT